MFAIKIHLDPAEHAALSRYASVLHVRLEDVAYAALDCLMKKANETEIRQCITETALWRKENLPVWADTERSVHAYEGSADDQPEERVQF